MSLSDQSKGKGVSDENGMGNGLGMLPIDHPKERSLDSMTRSNSQRRVHMSLTRMPSGSRSEVSIHAGKTSLTRPEILSMASICCGNFCLGTLYALLAPFFPYEVRHHCCSCC